MESDADDLLFDMEQDLPDEIPPTNGQVYPTFVFAPRGLDAGSTASPLEFDGVVAEAVRRLGEQGGARRETQGDGRAPQPDGEGGWRAEGNLEAARRRASAQPPPTPTVQPATPARPTSQSAADLVAAFVAPTPNARPIPIPAGPPARNGAATGVGQTNPAL